MSVRFFLDTNIFIYSFDSSAPKKQQKSQQLISDALSSNNGIISFQVVQEFINVSTKKFKTPFSFKDCREYLEEILLPLCCLFPGNEFYLHTLDIKERTRFSFYDSMIICAALESECRTLYSEDFKHGFKFFDLTIINPFK